MRPLRAVRLIASDLDGTLLDRDRTVSPRTVTAIRAADAAGLVVIAATGRQACQLPPGVSSSGVRYAVASNGAIGVDLRGNDVLFEDQLSATVAADIVAALRQRLPAARFSAVRDHGTWHAAEPGYLELLNPEERDNQWWRIEAVTTAEMLAEPTLKLTVRHPRLDADDLLAELSACDVDGFHATTSGAPFLEIAGAGVTKASGVARLCELLHLTAAEVMALGDARNDIELLSWAGTSVAMGNAVPEAAAVADWVTATNEEDGVALAIETVLAQGAA